MSSSEENYTVLARKYRPQTFKDLIGQEILTQTLTNAIEQDRLAHAYLLTGIRGVGKTSTARIIAKALSCIGKDGNGKATAEPCGECENCKAIAESRHVDVLEMDAASRTGVGDVREIIENASYLPTSARYKIYIIDEIHMLSKNAFNALLKTLEEPPPHVKFIFATTEVRKIPVTILSRCQRFDLPRVSAELLEAHLVNIAEKESVKIDNETIAVIANIAEGSVRDALSLLDQAIAHSGEGKDITGEQVQKMLGLLGKENLLSLFEEIAKGDVKAAITILREMYVSGADPIMILNDLLELSHVATQVKVIPDLEEPAHLSKGDFSRIQEMAKKLEVPFLTRCWQMLLKGLQEAQIAPNPLIAVEMIIIRIAYASNTPTPSDLIKKINKDGIPTEKPTIQAPSEAPDGVPVQQAHPQTFEEMVALFKEKGELFLYNWIQNEVHLISFAPGKLNIRVGDSAPTDLANKIMLLLSQWTGSQWLVSVSQEQGDSTIKQKRDKKFDDQKQAAAESDDVVKILAAFPGAKIIDITPIKEESKPSKIQEIKQVKSGEQS
jgi:DNA polymerase-3 subunit gamma/tau